MVQSPQELVSTLKAQHRSLQADLSAALDGTNSALALTKFRNDLLEHLQLENEVFYPDYLEKQGKKGEDVTKTKEFIKQMDDIGNVVMAFLNKYNAAEAITATTEDFKKELETIIRTLNLRIETEEEGVFGLYLLM